VRVIDDDGAQLGIMTPAQALSIAEEKLLDLVEIAPTATPPVCRIMNSGKFFYQQAKREAEARKHQRHIQVKEIKFRCKIDEHDFVFKAKNAERFLLDGNKVKSTVIFRGREMAHNEIGRRILERLARELTEVALIEVPPRQEGMTMVQILTPKEKIAKPVKKGAGEKAEKSAKAEKTEKSPKAEKADKPEKADKAEKPEKADKAEKPETADKPEKAPEKADKPEKAEKPEKAPRAKAPVAAVADTES
jgi:translation initiation factor IF-3